MDQEKRMSSGRASDGDFPSGAVHRVREAPGAFSALVRQKRRAALALSALAVFSVLLYEVLGGEVLRLDAAAHALFVDALRASWLTPVMEGFSALASPLVLVVVLLVIATFAPGRRPGWCCAVNLVFVALLNAVLKALVARPRPEGFRLVEETGFSFPSGHSMVAMAFFGLIIYLIWRYGAGGKRRIALAAVFAFIIVMIGISRIYLGVHYASDVLGGFCASLLWLVFYTRFAVPLFLGDPEPAARADKIE